MHIAEVQIKNFRIFTDLQLTLNPGLNLFVGENNSGKTALVDAIPLCKQMKPRRRLLIWPVGHDG